MMVFEYCVPELGALFWIVVLVMFAVVALFYMLGRALQRSDFEAIARNELRQVAISVVLGFALIALAVVLCDISKTLMTGVTSKGEARSHFDYSTYYLKFLTYNKGLTTITGLWTLSYEMFVASSSIKLAGTKWLGGLNVLSQMINRLLEYFFGGIVASLHIQIIALYAAQAFAFTLILPAGIVLRAIPFTREGGCFLIALAFAAYIVMPFLYVMEFTLSQQLWPEEFSKEITPAASGAYEVIKPAQAANPSLTYITKILTITDKTALLVLQATLVGMFNLTILIAFVRVFADFVKGFD